MFCRCNRILVYGKKDPVHLAVDQSVFVFGSKSVIKCVLLYFFVDHMILLLISIRCCLAK